MISTTDNKTLGHRIDYKFIIRERMKVTWSGRECDSGLPITEKTDGRASRCARASRPRRIPRAPYSDMLSHPIALAPHHLPTIDGPTQRVSRIKFRKCELSDFFETLYTYVF